MEREEARLNIHKETYLAGNYNIVSCIVRQEL